MQACRSKRASGVHCARRLSGRGRAARAGLDRRPEMVIGSPTVAPVEHQVRALGPLVDLRHHLGVHDADGDVPPAGTGAKPAAGRARGKSVPPPARPAGPRAPGRSRPRTGEAQRPALGPAGPRSPAARSSNTECERPSGTCAVNSLRLDLQRSANGALAWWCAKRWRWRGGLLGRARPAASPAGCAASLQPARTSGRSGGCPLKR